MKHSKYLIRRQLQLHMFAICLTVTSLLTSGSVYASPKPNNAPDTTTNNHIVIDRTVSPIQDPANTQSNVGRKHILNDEAKDLSGFFIIGIAINLIMAVSFAWWFTREWRRSRK
jgi:hypothetical protein